MPYAEAGGGLWIPLACQSLLGTYHYRQPQSVFGVCGVCPQPMCPHLPTLIPALTPGTTVIPVHSDRKQRHGSGGRMNLSSSSLLLVPIAIHPGYKKPRTKLKFYHLNPSESRECKRKGKKGQLRSDGRFGGLKKGSHWILNPDYLQGDSTKAFQRLGWKPKVTFEELVKEMVDADVLLMKKNPNA
ncbi:hypothetical protein NQZ68_038619 [Dissostichus eleginoides]|nr:hypothetical protein NQZ68_038619 [Dissostichus eleginoides]